MVIFDYDFGDFEKKINFELQNSASNGWIYLYKNKVFTFQKFFKIAFDQKW